MTSRLTHILLAALTALALTSIVGCPSGTPADKPVDAAADKPDNDKPMDDKAMDEKPFDEAAAKKEAKANAEKEITPENAAKMADDLEKELEADDK